MMVPSKFGVVKSATHNKISGSNQCLYRCNDIWPSANKDSNCWGQDISSSYSKSIENTRLSLCFFKTMASKENMLKISW